MRPRRSRRGQLRECKMRWVVATVSCAQSLILVTTHTNDVRLAAGTLWQRRLALPWMIRLAYAGVPLTWVWTFGTYALLTLAVAFICFRPRYRNARALTLR